LLLLFLGTSRTRRTRRWKIPLALSLRARRSKPSAARDAIDEVSVVLLALAKRYPSKRESFLALFLFFSPFSRKKKFPLLVRKPAQARLELENTNHKVEYEDSDMNYHISHEQAYGWHSKTNEGHRRKGLTAILKGVATNYLKNNNTQTLSCSWHRWGWNKPNGACITACGK
jgi:hypothetical protein